MSLRLEMLQVARLAPKLLGDSADLVREFLLRQQNDDGGFKDRTGRSDLYYTVFGLEGLLALQAPVPVERVASYLRSCGCGEDLDFVHACCLARCWAALANADASVVASQPAELRTRLLARIAEFRSTDGGFNPAPRSPYGTAYGCFLGLGAHQDLHAQLPEPLRVVQSLKFLETPEGAWANDRNVKIGSTNATAAAVSVLRNLQVPVNASVGQWLLAQCHAEGGFLALPRAPMPDLLSTATALHALAGLQVPLDAIKDPCLDFIDTLWTNEGSFHGNWTDDHLDCEYTYYGLLALGHLSL
ncbi:MAG: prenyltransferase/squalene oxidase repeat-containing protein [Verrucomicrobiota bacterium]